MTRILAVAVVAVMAVGLGPVHGFEMTAIERGGTIRWEAVEGHAYTVEIRDDLAAGWETVPPVDQWPILGTEWVVNDGAGWPAAAKRFYRVMAEPAQIEDDYMVIDLSAGPSASSYPVSYLSAVPPGGWTVEYRTTKLVLRRIPAGTFTMGSPMEELGRFSDETQHQVTLTRDFYIGVFEVTQKQWERVMGTWPGHFENVDYRDARPVEQVSYDMIRGSGAGAGWPENNEVDDESFMGRLRERTGRAFDLPTESQWEYACRAGTTTGLNSGKNLTSTSSCPNTAEVGRYYHNHPGGFSASPSVSTDGGTAKVGSYLANAWGLHDMHGNVWEWCLDWHGTYPGTVTDPKGASTGPNRVHRGGSWIDNARLCRSAYRGGSWPSYEHSGFGFRAAVAPGQ